MIPKRLTSLATTKMLATIKVTVTPMKTPLLRSGRPLSSRNITVENRDRGRGEVQNDVTSIVVACRGGNVLSRFQDLAMRYVRGTCTVDMKV